MAVSVLVVEDQRDILARVANLLETAGYVVHGAESPDEALEILARLPRPCILLWDALTTRDSLTLVDQAVLEGVHVASLPVTVTSIHLADFPQKLTKRLTSEEAILRVVEEHCPSANKAIA